jgi:ectoine hydroxylase-related dioxygenase (phytanoyl-CoA dioxygenase family)
MVHGSFENKTDRPRRATVINVFRDGVVSDSDLPPLEGVRRYPGGSEDAGTNFSAIVYSRTYLRIVLSSGTSLLNLCLTIRPVE